MAETALVPSCAKLHLHRSVLKRSNFIPRDAFIRIGQREDSYGIKKNFLRLSPCKAWELGVPMVKISGGGRWRFREFSLRHCFVLPLINPDNAMPLEWVPIVDQVFFMASVVCAYMAGVVPSEKANFSNRTGIIGNNVVPANSTSSGSAARNDRQVNS